jgi:hypothetical protein
MSKAKSGRAIQGFVQAVWKYLANARAIREHRWVPAPAAFQERSEPLLRKVQHLRRAAFTEVVARGVRIENAWQMVDEPIRMLIRHLVASGRAKSRGEQELSYIQLVAVLNWLERLEDVAGIGVPSASRRIPRRAACRPHGCKSSAATCTSAGNWCHLTCLRTWPTTHARFWASWQKSLATG